MWRGSLLSKKVQSIGGLPPQRLYDSGHLTSGQVDHHKFIQTMIVLYSGINMCEPGQILLSNSHDRASLLLLFKARVEEQ